jgi:DNA-binding FadR family transcriptional regulator
MSVDAVTRELRRRLSDDSAWKVGERFYTFAQLMDVEFPADLTSINKVRAALAPLIAEGLVQSRQGSGTWVLRNPPELSANSVSDLAGQILADFDALRVKIEELKRMVSGTAARTIIAVVGLYLAGSAIATLALRVPTDTAEESK